MLTDILLEDCLFSLFIYQQKLRKKTLSFPLPYLLLFCFLLLYTDYFFIILNITFQFLKIRKKFFHFWKKPFIGSFIDYQWLHSINLKFNIHPKSRQKRFVSSDSSRLPAPEVNMLWRLFICVKPNQLSSPRLS